MIGGINPGNNYGYQTGNNSLVRGRSDAARAPASTPDGNAVAARRDLSDGGQQPVTERSASELPERRVEARRAVEDARLERFRADEVPLPTARALATFAVVAAGGQETGGDTVLAGIDVMV